MNVRAPNTPGAHFRSPSSTLSSRTSNHGEQHVGSSPLVGPSRHTQLALSMQQTPSYEPVHIGAVPLASKVGSYSGPPPTRSHNSPRTTQVPSRNNSVQPPLVASPTTATQATKASSRFSAPGALLAAPVVAEEVTFTTPAWAATPTTPQVSQPGNVAPGPSCVWAPNRTPPGQQPNSPIGQQPQRRLSARESGASGAQGKGGRPYLRNISPDTSKRQAKHSSVSSPDTMTNTKRDSRDQENCDNNYVHRRAGSMEVARNRNVEKGSKQKTEILQDSFMAYNAQERRDACVHCDHFKGISEELSRELQKYRDELQNTQDCLMINSAKMAEREARIAQLEEENAEREKAFQHEGRQIQQRDFEELEARKKENDKLGRQCSLLEKQKNDLEQQLRAFEKNQRDMERNQSLVEREKVAEMNEKDAKLDDMSKRLREMEVALRTKDTKLEDASKRFREMEAALRTKDNQIKEANQRVHETECLMHDKEQVLQQMTHEHQKQDVELRRRLRDTEDAKKVLEDKIVQLERNQNKASSITEREIKDLKKVRVEQNKAMFELETQLRKAGNGANITAPGEFLRLAKQRELEGNFSRENYTLRSRVNELETESELLKTEIEALKSHLPNVQKLCAAATYMDMLQTNSH